MKFLSFLCVLGVALTLSACKEHLGEGIGVFDVHFTSNAQDLAFEKKLADFLKLHGFQATSGSFLDSNSVSDDAVHTVYVGSYDGSQPFSLRLQRTANGQTSVIHASIEWRIHGSHSDAAALRNKINKFLQKMEPLISEAQRDAEANP